jgi:hypothetical protein
MRRILVLVLGITMALVLTLGSALAAPPEVVVDRSVTTFLHGDSGEFHYHIFVFAGQSEALTPNAAVEVEVFDSNHDLVAGPCFAGEKQLDAPASLEIAQGLVGASFEGVYADSGCFWGDASFDLYWTATGRLINENSKSGEAGEFCHETYRERSAAAVGTVQFSSGSSTSQFAVESDSAMVSIEAGVRCLMPGPPQPG